MTTNTAQNHHKSILTFNVFYREDTTTQSFLTGIISKSHEHWAFFRNILTGEKGCRLTIVDKSVETPFHCLLIALFCKQLEEQLHARMDSITLILSPLQKNRQNGGNTVNMPFDTTDHRNEFLQECFAKVLGRKVKIATKRNPVHCRDVKISAGDYVLYLRFEGGMANGWQVDDAYISRLSPKELLAFALNDIKCRNIFTHGFSQNGVFINVDLLTKHNALNL
jgi:hypothetical protein